MRKFISLLSVSTVALFLVSHVFAQTATTPTGSVNQIVSFIQSVAQVLTEKNRNHAATSPVHKERTISTQKLNVQKLDELRHFIKNSKYSLSLKPGKNREVYVFVLQIKRVPHPF